MASCACQALDYVWTDNIPEGLSAKERNNTVRAWLVAKRLSVQNDIAKAIQRALNARQARKNKTVPAPRSRAALLAAADEKAFAEAISRRGEALVKRRRDGQKVGVA
jgi:hypothetical protein